METGDCLMKCKWKDDGSGDDDDRTCIIEEKNGRRDAWKNKVCNEEHQVIEGE